MNVTSEQSQSKEEAGEATIHCDFCGKSQHKVRKIVAGPKVFICNECVECCRSIIEKEGSLMEPNREKQLKRDQDQITQEILKNLEAVIGEQLKLLDHYKNLARLTHKLREIG